MSTFKPTSTGKRFLNAIIDLLLYFIVLIVVLTIYFAFSGNQQDNRLLHVIGFAVYLAYYIYCEFQWGKTPAKFITRTKVVSIKGSHPTLASIALRTIGRLIPLEWFSFLHPTPQGWHDRLSKTIVVDDHKA